MENFANTRASWARLKTAWRAVLRALYDHKALAVLVKGVQSKDPDTSRAAMAAFSAYVLQMEKREPPA